MISLLIPRLVIFTLGVIAFLVGLYFNKRDDERDKALYEEQRKRAEALSVIKEQNRLFEQERLLALMRERSQESLAVKALNSEESQTPALGAGAAGATAQAEEQQPGRVIQIRKAR